MVSVVNCYFMCQDGSMFKAQVDHSPYFYLQVKEGMEMEVDSWLRRKFGGSLRDVEMVDREDLDLKNHLSGIKRRLLKLVFWNVDQLMSVRREVQPIVSRNRNRRDRTDAYAALAEQQRGGDGASGSVTGGRGRGRMQEAAEAIVDMREYDVPYHVRFAIDTDVRCGHWFTARAAGGKVTLERRPDLLQRAEPRICAFDIECTKLPLQFPNAEHDQVFMISYMLDRQGYLIINREVVSEDIQDFEYTPKPEFDGPFHVFNCANEEATLRCWFDHMRETKPGVYVTYNGDFFDWPFIETRAAKYGMDMAKEIGFKCNRGAQGGSSGECLSPCAVHMDCLHWVNRDSYLPQGSRGLKVKEALFVLLGSALGCFLVVPVPGLCWQAAQQHLPWTCILRDKHHFSAHIHHHILILKLFLPVRSGGDQVQVGVRPCGGGPRGHGAPGSGAAAGHGIILSVRCRGNVLPLHDLRPPVHLLAVHHHPHAPGRGAAQGVGHVVRGPPHGAGVPGQRGGAQQTHRRS